jgi:hypothetical protein
MPTECSPALFDLAPVEGRRVVAGFDSGAITSKAGARLLGATDRAITLVSRFAACFRDARMPERIEHDITTLVGQRIFGIALGHAPPRLAQDRRAGPQVSPTRHHRHGVRPSLPERVRPRSLGDPCDWKAAAGRWLSFASGVRPRRPVALAARRPV